MELKKVSFKDECPSIAYTFQLASSGKNPFRYTLVVQFRGSFRYGSEGNADADFMLGIIETAIRVWNPDKLIIDLSRLAYTWGNAMFDIVFYSHPSTRAAIVVGPDCRKGLSSLIHIDSAVPESQLFFNTVKEAFDYLQSV